MIFVANDKNPCRQKSQQAGPLPWRNDIVVLRLHDGILCKQIPTSDHSKKCQGVLFK